MVSKEELECLIKVLRLLQKTRNKFDKIWEDAGLDLAYFNVDINLSVKVDDVKVEVADSWRSINE